MSLLKSQFIPLTHDCTQDFWSALYSCTEPDFDKGFYVRGICINLGTNGMFPNFIYPQLTNTLKSFTLNGERTNC